MLLDSRGQLVSATVSKRCMGVGENLLSGGDGCNIHPSFGGSGGGGILYLEFISLGSEQLG